MNVFFIFLLGFLVSSCTKSNHPSEIAPKIDFIEPTNLMKTKQLVKVKFTKVKAADWEVNRSGLINLDDPKSQAAGLVDGKEPIQIYFYVVDHPSAGRFFIDSGIEDALLQDARNSKIPYLIYTLMNMESLNIHQSTKAWIQRNPRPIKGVFLTHMHIDHLMGFPDLPKDINIYVGPSENSSKTFQNIAVNKITTYFLDGHRPLQELQFQKPRPDLVRAIDFFGDQSFIVFHLPGHTPGSLGFFIRGEDMDHLVVGDTSHTRWGWEHSVSPGSYTENRKQNQEKLDWLTAFAGRYPEVLVHLGHQSR